ncbi:cytotoxic necrotizing factor Rho-activating domain-containing protein [Vibrio cholerae]|uniref:cytotoxic necrotizing factor Rho-activating domain-containing protein n=1 Tax=Vibrio cholerae TaxID=666 RepID=UPI001E384C8E|nr:cytotoxic necrotizing factor Rho-activating domain-containing protein [Vibrio cholerae]MCD1245973.1 cytotoxin [Vibrio cholerae]
MLEPKQIFMKSYNLPLQENVEEARVQLKSVRKLSNEEIEKMKHMSFPNDGMNKAKKSKLQTLVVDSFVINDSNHIAAKAFANDPKFNKNNTKKSSIANAQLMKSLEKGDVGVLKGKGVINGESTSKQLPFTCDVVRYDKNGFKSSSCINQSQDGVQVITGDHIRSAQLIPGTPLGQFYNTNAFSENVNVVYIPNGDRGLTALKIPLSEIEKNKNILISFGALSGCTSVTAIDSDCLYVFHVGKKSNDSSSWKTNQDGAEMVRKCAENLSGVSSQSCKSFSELQSLVNYCSNAFSKTAIQYCGHGEKIKTPQNVITFDYNTPQKSNPIRVGSNLTLINNFNGKINISTLCDDMTIDKNRYDTKSIDHKVVKLT